MASGVNKVILVGNLGADPEVRTTPSGQSVANLRVATTEYWNDKDGNKQERTEWHNVVVWGRSAEHCGQYLSKGRQVFVEGRLQSREYTDRDGNNRRVWDVVANNVVFLQGGGTGGGGGAGGGGAGGGGWGGGGGGQQGGGGGGWGGGGGQQGGGGGRSGGGSGGGGGWGGGGQQGGSGGGWGGGGDTGGGAPGGGPAGGGAPGGGGFDDDPIPF